MNCPYCQKAMKSGYFIHRDQPIQWIPEGAKPSVWKTGVADGAVVLGSGSYWKSYRANAWYCPRCKTVIAPENAENHCD